MDEEVYHIKINESIPPNGTEILNISIPINSFKDMKQSLIELRNTQIHNYSWGFQ